mmetsp:Transcript_19333/g.55669  ORF Transcript_19333/g.55669 Transcript_19333/m.55669 type:complete len:688 (+) Transcript_19333:571-2634(+)|eukprot:CAMPEP_0181040474 /NCGR_PEP_ID=MMETSP1070-20121207/11067_1 /TAXON_ID=265543 /ORGANISM="Minutocellus polymorphus, Strain NH13" /LENGTH=687 /DNA_ID=CAMNT_0023118485 /DNA_START=548 /DNA_END=2611 /DNA_ORIENTATION=+
MLVASSHPLIRFVALLFGLSTFASATFVQTEPLRVNEDVRVVGLTFESAKDSNSVKIRAPKDAEPGDILIIYIGGSASGNKIPSDPGKEWDKIIDIGKEDLNLKAFWKAYETSDAWEELSLDIGIPGFKETESEHRNASIFSTVAADDWKISDGKNTFVSIVALRGIDGRKPIVDADADEDTADGKEGDAKAPSVRAEKGGIVLACYIFDDPHVARVKDNDFEMLLSSDPGGDGMAIAVAPTKSDGNTGTIRAEGRREEKGGGDDIAMTLSLRPAIDLTDPPTSSPTGTSKNTCNTEEEISCRDLCYIDKNCGADRRSLCHRVCRFDCCSDSPSSEDRRSCLTSDEKICRESCFNNSCSGGVVADISKCRDDCKTMCCHEDKQLHGSLLLPDRVTNTLYMFRGDAPMGRNSIKLLDKSSALWSMRLHPVELWRGDNSINDVRRIIHKDRVHLAIAGNGGNVVALYDFESSDLVYYSSTCGNDPHDVEYIPLEDGFLAVADARGSESMIELYDVSGQNDIGCIEGSIVDHKGVHSLHWDGKQRLLWAWGAGNAGLVSYKVVFDDDSGRPRLEKEDTFFPDFPGFYVGTGHGSSPMIENGKRYLLLAGKSGILRFDTESHLFTVEQLAEDDGGLYSNPKGVSYNEETGEVILARSDSNIYSLQSGTRSLNGSEIYKAKWWQVNTFSDYA